MSSSTFFSWLFIIIIIIIINLFICLIFSNIFGLLQFFILKNKRKGKMYLYLFSVGFFFNFQSHCEYSPKEMKSSVKYIFF